VSGVGYRGSVHGDSRRTVVTGLFGASNRSPRAAADGCPHPGLAGFSTGLTLHPEGDVRRARFRRGSSTHQTCLSPPTPDRVENEAGARGGRAASSPGGAGRRSGVSRSYCPPHCQMPNTPRKPLRDAGFGQRGGRHERGVDLDGRAGRGNGSTGLTQHRSGSFNLRPNRDGHRLRNTESTHSRHVNGQNGTLDPQRGRFRRALPPRFKERRQKSVDGLAVGVYLCPGTQGPMALGEVGTADDDREEHARMCML
jgi:hypothetical protein